MWKPPIPVDEEERLEDLHRLGILLTTPEEPLDRVTRQLASVFGVPGAFISFIDQDTQHYKSEVGLPPEFAESRTEPREISLCSYVVGTNEPLYAEDLAADPVFQDSPGVLQFGVRFYAGVPLRGDGGHAVGSLCILDQRPREITERERQMLELIAEGVMAQVRLQTASRQLLDRSFKIERDLQQAIAVQRYLLPEPVTCGSGWRIEHLYRPVDHLGGDLLDVRHHRDGSWIVLMADVTGHGTTAALTATMTKAAFGTALQVAASPSEILATMNRELVPVTPPGQLVTAQVARLAPNSGEMVIASAGHPFPLRVRGDATELIATRNGVPLIVDEDASYHELAIDNVAPGESILLYTDGAFETTNASREQLGIDGFRARAAAATSGGSVNLQELLDTLIEYACGRVDDDIALLLVRRDTSA